MEKHLNIWSKGVEGGVSGFDNDYLGNAFPTNIFKYRLKVRRKKSKRGGQLMMTIRLSNSRS